MKNKDKIILDLCGGTGSWSKPYKDAGYDVRLITLPKYDVFEYEPPKNVYGILAAPTCTHFSMARMNPKSDPRDLKEALKLVRRCLHIIWQCQYELETITSKTTRLKFWALENPKGFLKYFLGNPPYEFSPFEFGDDYKKRTHIWGNFNYPIKTHSECDTKKFDALLIDELPELPKDYKYDKGCGMDVRQVRRSITPKGFAKAFYEVNQ